MQAWMESSCDPAEARFPPLETAPVRRASSRRQLPSAIMRAPAEESFGIRERQALMVSAKGSNDCGIVLDVAGFEVVPAGGELVPMEGLGREGALAPVG